MTTMDKEILAHAQIAELKVFEVALRDMTALVRARNEKWWIGLTTGLPIKRNVGELLMLHVSEAAEATEGTPAYHFHMMEITKHFAKAMEGHRKNLMDDKLPHRPMVEVECADVLIRLLDFCGGLGFDLAGAFFEKMEYNRTRVDHTHKARLAPGGKAY